MIFTVLKCEQCQVAIIIYLTAIIFTNFNKSYWVSRGCLITLCQGNLKLVRRKFHR